MGATITATGAVGAAGGIGNVCDRQHANVGAVACSCKRTPCGRPRAAPAWVVLLSTGEGGRVRVRGGTSEY